MAELLYKTRANSTPQGKPRVYFCCHPEDFAPYFETVCDDILSRHNCAVWYKSAVKMDDGVDFFDDLERMNLFVVPVSENLLAYQDANTQRELEFALERHIPVLPLVQQAGLVEKYDHPLFALQYLDRTVVDETAESYGKKLEKYLDSVLIGDSLAKRIRDEFSAYMFLSYRKKDRRHANRLMRIIHSKTLCRDMAIWYDEFLVPGEAFDGAIRKALDKSGMFVLAVTPNLVNEENYVMTTEYPLAKSSGKVILPAVMQHTDYDLLQQKYSGIPKAVDAESEDFDTALAQSLEKVQVSQKEETPMHRYLIGLAYLGGIDVEVDYAKAVRLITLAAEENCPEAVEKLANMYRNGEGVARDYNKAAEYHRQLVDIYRSLAENGTTQQDGKNYSVLYLTESEKLAAELMKLGRLEEASEIYMEFYDMGQQITDGEGQPEGSVMMLVYATRMAEVCRNQGQFAKAEEWCRTALQLAGNAGSSEQQYLLKTNLSQVHSTLGSICGAKGQFEQAKQHNLKSLEIYLETVQTVDGHSLVKTLENTVGAETAQQFMADKMDMHRRCELATRYNNVAYSCIRLKQYDQALPYAEKYLEMMTAIAEETKEELHISNLTVACSNMAVISWALQDAAKAGQYNLKAMEIAVKLAEETDTFEAWRNVGLAYMNLAGTSSGDEEQQWLQKALQVRRAIAQQSDMVDDWQNLAKTLEKLGQLAKNSGDTAKWLHYAEEQLECWAKAAHKGDLETFDKKSAALCSMLAKHCLDGGDVAGARRYYIKMVEFKQMLQQKHGTPKLLNSIAVDCTKVAQLYNAERKYGLGLKYYKEAQKVMEKLVAENPSQTYTKNLAAVYRNIAICHTKEKRAGMAKEYIRKAEKLEKQIGDNP